MKFNIKKEYHFDGLRKDFFKMIEKAANTDGIFKFETNPEYQDEFKVFSNFSLGTDLSLGRQISNGITIYGEIESVSEKKQLITLKTETRVEVSFLIIFSIIAYIVMIIKINLIPIWTFLISPVTIWCFFNVYRWQEKSLLRKIEENLKINPIIES